MKVRFPPRWSRYFLPEYESDNYTFLKNNLREGMHVIDIGAHIGLFSVCCAKLTGPSGKIICFEPTPGTFAILKETIRLNKCRNITASEVAVGSKAGKATFYISNTFEGCNANSLVLNKKEAKGYEVAITTLDLVCSDHAVRPDLIKIDVEGAELEVLKGGDHTFKTIRPIIILGLHPSFIQVKGDSLAEIWELIKGYQYKVLLNGSEMDKKDFISQIDIFDVQCIPV